MKTIVGVLLSSTCLHKQQFVSWHEKCWDWKNDVFWLDIRSVPTPDHKKRTESVSKNLKQVMNEIRMKQIEITSMKQETEIRR